MRMDGKNPLTAQLDRFCSDKGSHFLSRHHYSTAYHALLGPRRDSIRNFVEIGIGEDTAPSVAAWRRYLPHASIFALDNKKATDIKDRLDSGATGRMKARQKEGGCEHDDAVWDARVRLTTDTDATDAAQVARAALPPRGSADVIIDDGSHRLKDQEKTLALLWDTLSPNGLYIIEDVFVGALPWSQEHAKQAPTANDPAECRHECYYPQRLSEHPLMFDRFRVGGARASARPALLNTTQAILRDHDWFWVVTGMHQGGGLDCSVVIRKRGEDAVVAPAAAAPPAQLASTPAEKASLLSSILTAEARLECPPPPPLARSHGGGAAFFVASSSILMNVALAAALWFRRRHYVRLSQD